MFKKLNVLLLLASISVTVCKAQKEATTETAPSMSCLKDTFKEAFFMGAALNSSQYKELNPEESTLIKREFNSITPENDMKWGNIHPKQDAYNFELADAYVSFGEKNNMYTVGHTLVWHSQLAFWVNRFREKAGFETVLTDHINTIVKRYKGRIAAWDVVNEALNEDGSPRESKFYKIMGGENYIELAFKLAAKADPEAQLIYNDYNVCKASKREGVTRIVKNLKSKGIKIDAVGIQAHWGLEHPSIETIEETINALHDLGVKVVFSELDIGVLPNPWDLVGAAVEQNFTKYEKDPKMNPYKRKLPKKIDQQLAKRYEDIFKLFLKHQEKISRVTFWGLSDGHSWLNNWPIKNRTNYPLLFDRKNKPKSAYFMVNALDN